MYKEQQILDFVSTQLGLHIRTNGIKTKQAATQAMNENKAKWVKMAILTIG